MDATPGPTSSSRQRGWYTGKGVRDGIPGAEHQAVAEERRLGERAGRGCAGCDDRDAVRPALAQQVEEIVARPAASRRGEQVEGLLQTVDEQQRWCTSRIARCQEREEAGQATRVVEPDDGAWPGEGRAAGRRSLWVSPISPRRVKPHPLDMVAFSADKGIHPRFSAALNSATVAAPRTRASTA